MEQFDEEAWLRRLARAGTKAEIQQLVEEMTQGEFDTLPKGLLCLTKDLMASLPANIRPDSLAVQFPRILNRIALLWAFPAECEEYLNSLVVDDRGNRAGFPFSVLSEISTLRSYYHDENSTMFRSDVWSKAHGLGRK